MGHHIVSMIGAGSVIILYQRQEAGGIIICIKDRGRWAPSFCLHYMCMRGAIYVCSCIVY